LIATKSVLKICEESGLEFRREDLNNITIEVRDAAQKIIEAKKSTYYGIGMALTRITKAIFGNENSVLTLSAYLDGEYGRSGVYTGVPCIVNRSGTERILTLSLTDEEIVKFNKSCDLLENVFSEISFD